MIDEFADQRLPDLPTDGYATRRERALTDEIMFFIRGAERDRLFLLSLVCDGQDKFRRVAHKAWHHLRADTDLCDAVFRYLELLAGAHPHLQRDILLHELPMTGIDHVWGRRP